MKNSILINLIFESQIHLDNIIIEGFFKSLGNATHNTRMAVAPIRQGNINDNHDASIGVPKNELTGLGNGIVISAIGVTAYALYKYFKSITHYNRVLKSLEEKLKNEKDRSRKEQIQSKIKAIKSKLVIAQQKSREKHADYIQDSRILKQKIESTSNPQEKRKLQEKYNKRKEFLNKIGVKSI